MVCRLIYVTNSTREGCQGQWVSRYSANVAYTMGARGKIDDHEGIVERPTPDVGQGQDFEHVAAQHLVDDGGGGDRRQRVEDRLAPGGHLLVL